MARLSSGVGVVASPTVGVEQLTKLIKPGRRVVLVEPTKDYPRCHLFCERVDPGLGFVGAIQSDQRFSVRSRNEGHWGPLQTFASRGQIFTLFFGRQALLSFKFGRDEFRRLQVELAPPPRSTLGN